MIFHLFWYFIKGTSKCNQFFKIDDIHVIIILFVKQVVCLLITFLFTKWCDLCIHFMDFNMWSTYVMSNIFRIAVIVCYRVDQVQADTTLINHIIKSDNNRRLLLTGEVTSFLPGYVICERSSLLHESWCLA